ncbi:MAG: hypothetical protein HGB18_05450 [Candidatus Moranbacteria bacterium]|nr:hypothetical protein [Candidatus Moranbacteria bacterium]
MHFVTDFNQAVLHPNPHLEKEILDRLFRTQCRPERCTRKAFARAGLPETLFLAVRDMVYEPEYRDRLQPAPGVIEVFRCLLEDGHDVSVVTSRTGNSCELAEAWFRERSGLCVPFVGIGKDREGMKMSKGPALRGLGADFYLDNSAKKLSLLVRERGQFDRAFPKLFHLRPRESDENWSPPYTFPIFSWWQVFEMVTAIAAS